MIDLHVHSTFSDGSLTPEQLVDRARDIGLTAIALTDHDSTGGINRFVAACETQRSEVRGQRSDNGQALLGIQGVEISANVKHGTLHMLGYLIDHRDGDLENVLERIREGRNIRNEEMLDRLKKLGLELSRKEVAAFAGDDVVGRPHFAQALVARGWVASTEAAFELYLAKGKPGYADRFRLSPSDSISVIRKAGGVPILAHPFTLELDGKALKKYVGELADMGLQGIEAYYSEYSREQQQEYLRLAEEFKLAVSGGSDFHGKLNPKIEIGTGFGSLRVPDGLVEELFRRVNDCGHGR